MIERLFPIAAAASVALAVLAAVPVTPAGAEEPAAAGKKMVAANSPLHVKVDNIDGKPVDLADAHGGKVVLVVNTASKCGLTPQYEGLEALYEKYKDKGFEVLAFPANEFGKQEPGTNAEIKEFCTGKYDVKFPIYSKIVVKGEGMHPLYKTLTSADTDPKFAGEIKWNFTKFLLNRKGEVIARFEPKETPDSPAMTKAIEAALATK